MKTTLQKVFSELERLHPSLFDIHTAKGKEFVDQFYKYLVMEKEQIIRAHLMARCYDTKNSVIEAEQYYNETYDISIQNPPYQLPDKEYRVWLEDSVEEEGGSWWYCKLNAFGYLYDKEHTSEQHDTLEWYLRNGYKVEEVSNG